MKAGLFRSVHKECEISHIKAKYDIINKISQSITSSTADYSALDNEITYSARTGYITQNELNELYGLGFDRAVETFLDDGVISAEEDKNISNYQKHFNLAQNLLNKNGSYEKVVKGLILKDILDGEIPKARLAISGNLPFLLEKQESIIWLFQNVEFYEQRTKTTFEGTSHGVSIKIAKGLYYRTGNFRGNPVTNTQMTLIGNGMFALTNKNLYFASSAKSLKTPYNKLISMTQYSDGIGLQKDGVNAKPQIFKGLDGWFTYNLIANLKNA